MLQVDQTISLILFQFDTHFLKKAALNYTQKFVQFTCHIRQKYCDTDLGLVPISFATER